MVVMQTSYFDQQRVEREKARRGRGRGGAAARPRRPWRVPAPFRKEPRGRSILHLDLSRRPPSFCPGYQGRGVLFDPRAGRRWLAKGSSESSLDSGGRGARGDGHQLFQRQRSRACERGDSVSLAFPCPRARAVAEGPRRAGQRLRSAKPGLLPARGALEERPERSLWLCLSVSCK